MRDVYQEIRAKYPFASVNSSRAIVRGWVDGFMRRKSQQRGDEVERDTGLPYDWSDGDWGIEKNEIDY